jgi:hypothetical protein
VEERGPGLEAPADVLLLEVGRAHVHQVAAKGGALGSRRPVSLCDKKEARSRKSERKSR